MMKKRIVVLAVMVAVLFALIGWIAWGNTALQQTVYTVSSERIPLGFDGYRIAHISDLHNTQIGEDNETLLAMLEDGEPDIIVITGDLIDSRNTDIGVALRFAEAAGRIAPCYYVTGNHEARIPEYEILKAGLSETGVVILEDASVALERSGEKMLLFGVNDPSFYTDYLTGDAESVMEDMLQRLGSREQEFTILLSHRPELFRSYVNSNVDLVLSGHAYGGQFRIPVIGGLVAPNQGFLPEYDAGTFTQGNTTMIVSRGIGNSIFPFRINNPPELLLIQLESMFSE